MKKVTFLSVLFSILLLPGMLDAQTREPVKLGFQINQVQGDFGLGLNLTVPIIRDRLTLRLAGSNQWLAAFDETETRNFVYQTLRLGATGAWLTTQAMRVYAEGGTMVVFPNAEASSTDMQFGGYGLFGFEFFLKEALGSSLFIEIGGTTSGVQADLLPNSPAFGSGLLLCSGFRIAF